MARSSCARHCQYACLLLFSWAAPGKIRNIASRCVISVIICSCWFIPSLCRLGKWVLEQLPYLFHFLVFLVSSHRWPHQPWVCWQKSLINFTDGWTSCKLLGSRLNWNVIWPCEQLVWKRYFSWLKIQIW